MTDTVPPPAPAVAPSAWYRSPALWLTLATILCLAPFANKAVHIDDYLFLRSAKQILAHPADPFGTMVNWYGFDMPLADVTQNPPGACYYLAAAGGLLGWSEPALHLAFLLPALAAVLGTYTLACRLCPQPALAALIALVSPVFWLSATTLMSDVPMLALWLWATVLWLQGLERSAHLRLGLAAVLVAAAALTKYFGAALIPLLIAYTCARARRPSWKLLWLALPILALTAYDLWTARRYGHGMLSGAGHYAQLRQDPARLWQQGLIALSFAGGCMIPVLFLARRLWAPRTLLLGVILCLGIVGLLPQAEALGTLSLHADGATRWAEVAQLALYIVAGLSILALAADDLRSARDADSLLLALWVLGTLVFTGALNWSINGRSILPLAPAVAILLVRKLARRAQTAPSPKAWIRHWPLLPAAAIAAAIVQADAAFAANSRTAARVLHEQLGGRGHPLWFQGHWGFQYYMEAHGACALDHRAPRLAAGDYLITPEQNTNVAAPPTEVFESIGNIETEPSAWFTTLQMATGAGFYADVWGPLPFAFGAGQPQRFEVARMRQRPWRY